MQHGMNYMEEEEEHEEEEEEHVARTPGGAMSAQLSAHGHSGSGGHSRGPPTIATASPRGTWGVTRAAGAAGTPPPAPAPVIVVPADFLPGAPARSQPTADAQPEKKKKSLFMQQFK